MEWGERERESGAKVKRKAIWARRQAAPLLAETFVGSCSSLPPVTTSPAAEMVRYNGYADLG